MTPDCLPWRSLLGATLALTLTACVPVTINIVFPQEKIDSAAENIESLVRTPKEAPSGPATPAPAKPAPRRRPASRAACQPSPGSPRGSHRWRRLRCRS
jgi:hypothetical protein